MDFLISVDVPKIDHDVPYIHVNAGSLLKDIILAYPRRRQQPHLQPRCPENGGKKTSSRANLSAVDCGDFSKFFRQPNTGHMDVCIPVLPPCHLPVRHQAQKARTIWRNCNLCGEIMSPFPHFAFPALNAFGEIILVFFL